MYEHMRNPNCSTVGLHHYCCSHLVGSHVMNSAIEQSGLPRMKPTHNVIKYPSMQVDNVVPLGDILQIAVLELTRKMCQAAPGEMGKDIKIIPALLQSD